jgi:hypothetical protein
MLDKLRREAVLEIEPAVDRCTTLELRGDLATEVQPILEVGGQCRFGSRNTV